VKRGGDKKTDGDEIGSGKGNERWMERIRRLKKKMNEGRERKEKETLL